MKKCNHCQTECMEDAIFCPECGERLEPEMGQEKTVDTQETVSEEIPEESQRDVAENEPCLERKAGFHNRRV